MKRLDQILTAVSVLFTAPCFAAPPEVGDERLQELLRRFPAADLNHDGKLTVEEFRQFRSKMQPGGTAAAFRPSAAIPDKTPASAATNTSPTLKVEIRITSAKPVPINPKIYGINCAEMFIFDLVQKPEYLSALGELQFNTFLFPGGSSYHHPTGTGGFNIREEEIAQAQDRTGKSISAFSIAARPSRWVRSTWMANPQLPMRMFTSSPSPVTRSPRRADH